MCTNYSPTKVERLRVLLGLGPEVDHPPETFPDYNSPLILINKDGARDCVVANFGFAPREFARADMPNPVNARAEMVSTNRMFGKYWKSCNLCIVQVDAVYEPCYESGRNVRHKIWIKEEFGIAGIWRTDLCNNAVTRPLSRKGAGNEHRELSRRSPRYRRR